MSTEPNMPRISSWEWDEGNLTHLRHRGMRRRTVRQVAEEAPLFRRNRGRRAASQQMLGPDAGGTLWVICIVAIPGKKETWRAITGWRASDREVAWYRRNR